MTETSYASLAGRVVLITGGASGIGAAFVRAFAGQQARVAFLDIDAAAGAALVQEVTAAGGAAPLFVPCDLLDIDALRAAMAKVHGTLGDAAVLVNNAANDQRQVLSEVTPEQFDWSIGVNLKHVFFAAQAVVPQMQARGGGSIINMSSVAWMRGAPAAAGLCGGEGCDRRLHQLAGQAGRAEPHSRQRDRARHGDHRAPAPAVVPGREADRRTSHAAVDSRCGDARGHRARGAVPGLRRKPAHHAPVFYGRRRSC